jgi:hypothetical protein
MALPVPANSGTVPPNSGQSFAEGMVRSLNMNTSLLMDSKHLLGEIADGIGFMKDAIEDSFKGSNLDSGTVQGNVEKEKDDGLASKMGDMLDSLKDTFDNLGAGKKGMLGIAALLGGIALMNAFSDELVEKLAPILKYFKEDLIPALKELNQIILDAPGGYLTLLGAAGLSKTLFDMFGKGGRIAQLFSSTDEAAKAVKTADLLDDLTVRKVGWGTRIRTAFTGRMTGLFGRIGGVFTSIGTSLRALGVSLVDDLALALKNLSPTWLKVLKLQVLGGDTIYPITKGGGKQIGILGKVSQSVEKIVTSLKNLNPFKNLTASLKTLGASWKLALSGALFGTAAGPAGAAGKAGVLGKITNAIARIAVIVKGIFSPTSILGKFTSKIKGIFAIIGKALGFVSKLTGLTSFLKLGLSLGKAIPIVGQVIMVLTGIFGFIKGAIEGFKTGGILGAIKGGLIGLYDGLIGSFLNLIADLIGWVFKKLGFEKLGEFFSNMNFNFDGIMNGIMWVIDKVKGVFHNVVNGLKSMANGVIKAINLVLPGRFEIDEFEITPYKSTYEPVSTASSEGMDVSDMPTIAENTSRVDTGNIDVGALSNVDYSNTMDNIPGAQFADIETGGVSDEEAQALVAEMTREPTAAEIAAAEAADNAKVEALVAAEMKRLELEADAEIARSGGAVQIYDTSSKSTLNNTTQVSNALSVDASDLVAAKLNLMLPAFN